MRKWAEDTEDTSGMSVYEAEDWKLVESLLGSL